MSDLFKKLKEESENAFVKGWVAAITTLIIALGAYFGPLIIPVLDSVPNNILLTFLGLFLMIIIGLSFWIWHLSEQLKNLKLENLKTEQFIKGYGVLWDKNYEPLFKRGYTHIPY
jgi:uncharacterized membrane protein YqjE